MTPKEKMDDTRYPYTYADDYVRSIAGYITPGDTGSKLSRSDASKILVEIANVLQLSHEFVAEKLADFYLENQEEITDKSVADFIEKVKVYK